MKRFPVLSTGLAAAVLATAAAPALAGDYRVEVRGVVEFNLINGALAPVPDGAPVVMRFELSSSNFLNSASFPTRGYAIELNTFTLDVGGVVLRLNNAQPGGNAYFVLRNNDPAVDGFFMSPGVELPFPLSMNIPGLTPVHDFNFSRSFSVGTALSSLNIGDAVGTYGFENMGAYQWTIGRFGNVGAEFAYQSITISPVPEPAGWALFGLGAMLLAAHQRGRRDKVPA